MTNNKEKLRKKCESQFKCQPELTLHVHENQKWIGQGKVDNATRRQGDESPLTIQLAATVLLVHTHTSTCDSTYL